MAITLSKEELFNMLQNAAELGATIALKKAGVITEAKIMEAPKVKPKRKVPLYKDPVYMAALELRILTEHNQKIDRLERKKAEEAKNPSVSEIKAKSKRRIPLYKDKEKIKAMAAQLILENNAKVFKENIPNLNKIDGLLKAKRKVPLYKDKEYIEAMKKQVILENNARLKRLEDKNKKQLCSFIN